MIFDFSLKKATLIWVVSTTLSHALIVQPGENIWHLAASIATQIQSLSQCGLIALPGTSITISTSGAYCLSEDLISGKNITIDASDVYLDLNGHTISNVLPLGSAIRMTQGQQRITIANGTIDSCLIGIDGSQNENVTISDVRISNVITGIGLQSTSNIFISNISISQFNDYGIILSECSYAQMKNCIIQNFTQPTVGTGYAFQARNQTAQLVKLAISDCTAIGDQGSGSVAGFFINNLNTDPSIIVFKNCISKNFNSYGFRCASENSSIPIICQNCTASNNLQAGFYISCSAGTFQNCIANKNNIGFYGIGTVTPSTTGMNDCLLENCNAHDNVASGFDFTTVGPNNVVKNCLATNNNVGFNTASDNTALYYFNTAIFNTTNNFSNTLGAFSAPINTMTGSREYGDNLRDALS